MLKNWLKVAYRNIIRHKVYSAINIVGLTIGIACGLLIVLFVQDELSYDRYHEKGDRIYRIYNVWKSQDGTSKEMPMGAYKLKDALLEAVPEIEAVSRFYPRGKLVQYGQKIFREENIAYTDANVFDVWDFSLTKGNPATALQEPFSAVISQSIASKYFGEENPIGQTLLIDEEHPFKITGVMQDIPRNSHFHFNMFFSMSTGPQVFHPFVLNNWGEGSCYNYVLLPEGYDPDGLLAQFPGLIEKYMGNRYLEFLGMQVQPMLDIHLKSHLRGELEPNGDIVYVYIFSIIAVFIVVIASINYMNLATARSAGRSLEVGMRKVLGAERTQLIRQFLGESVLLTIVAFVAGVLLAAILLPAFNDLAGKEIPIQVADQWPWLVGFLGLILVVGLGAGLYPAFFLSRFRPIAVLKGNIGIKSSNSMLRKSLVVFQFAISVVLIIGTIVIYSQLSFLQNKKLGFDKEHLLIMHRPENYEAFKAELLQDPSIVSVGASNKRFTNRLGTNLGFTAEGRDPSDRRSIKAVTVDFDFLKTIKANFTRGRDFDRSYGSDAREGFVLNEAAVADIGWDDPIGKWFKTSTVENDEWVPKEGKIIGTIADFHFESLHESIKPVVYFISDSWIYWLTIRIRPDDISATTAAIEKLWKKYEPAEPLELTFLDQEIQGLYEAEDRFLSIFLAFTALAILIACMGIFGLASFATQQRTREIGIRKVMGASVAHIVYLMSREFSVLVIIACLIAGPIAWYYMSSWLNEFTYHTDFGAWIFGVAVAMALGIAMLTVGLQAMKAARTSPVKTLKYE